MRSIAQISLVVAVVLGARQTTAADDTAPAASPASPKVSWFRRTFCSLTWSETAAVARSPKEICRRIRARVKYKKELGDKWTSGKETWKRGYGDCEDFAACVSDLCRQIGLQTRIYMFYNKRSSKGHVVTIGEWRGRMWMSSNGCWATIGSVKDARDKIAASMGWPVRETVSVAMPRNMSSLQFRGQGYARRDFRQDEPAFAQGLRRGEQD